MFEYIVACENISNKFDIHWAFSDQVQGHGMTLSFFSITVIQTVKTVLC